MPGPPGARRDLAAAAWARSRTVSANLLGGAIVSTRPHSSAVLARTPSLRVATTSARSLRTLRLSTSRVSPPVPGSTASSGTSGRNTAALPSSTMMISSQASASS